MRVDIAFAITLYRTNRNTLSSNVKLVLESNDSFFHLLNNQMHKYLSIFITKWRNSKIQYMLVKSHFLWFFLLKSKFSCEFVVFVASCCELALCIPEIRSTEKLLGWQLVAVPLRFTKLFLSALQKKYSNKNKSTQKQRTKIICDQPLNLSEQNKFRLSINIFYATAKSCRFSVFCILQNLFSIVPFLLYILFSRSS